MTVVKTLQHPGVLLAWLILLLSVLACSVPVATTPAQWTASPTTVLSTPSTTPRSAATTVTTVEVTAFEALHVRAAPGYQSEVIDYLYVGDDVTLTGKCSEDPKGWAQIEWGEGTAWVNAKFLSKNACSKSEEK